MMYIQSRYINLVYEYNNNNKETEGFVATKFVGYIKENLFLLAPLVLLY